MKRVSLNEKEVQVRESEPTGARPTRVSRVKISFRADLSHRTCRYGSKTAGRTTDASRVPSHHRRSRPFSTAACRCSRPTVPRLHTRPPPRPQAPRFRSPRLRRLRRGPTRPHRRQTGRLCQTTMRSSRLGRTMNGGSLWRLWGYLLGRHHSLSNSQRASHTSSTAPTPSGISQIDCTPETISNLAAGARILTGTHHSHKTCMNPC